VRLSVLHFLVCSAACAVGWGAPRGALAQEPSAPLRPVAPEAAPATEATLPQTVTIEPPRVRWRDEWPKFRVSEFVVTGIAAAAAFGSLAIPDGGGRFSLRNGFDDGARDAFRLSSKADREVARDLSDFFLIGLSNQLVIDTVVVAWWHHGAEEVAWQTTLITAEAIAVNVAINSTISGIVARQRPYGESCEFIPEEQQTSDCNGQRRYRSFYSGHTSTSFTAASVLCMNHMYLELYGGGAADVLACMTGYGAAGTVGAMRLIGDEHWMTDVLLGSAMGTAVGLGIPYFLHYSGGADPELPDEGDASSVRWLVMPTPTGGTLMGTF
jgi:membrane-associated phospholipid phosphatase